MYDNRTCRCVKLAAGEKNSGSTVNLGKTRRRQKTFEKKRGLLLNEGGFYFYIPCTHFQKSWTCVYDFFKCVYDFHGGVKNINVDGYVINERPLSACCEFITGS